MVEEMNTGGCAFGFPSCWRVPPVGRCDDDGGPSRAAEFEALSLIRDKQPRTRFAAGVVKMEGRPAFRDTKRRAGFAASVVNREGRHVILDKKPHAPFIAGVAEMEGRLVTRDR